MTAPVVREEQITFRVSEAEREELAEAAQLAGLTVGVWLRATGLATARASASLRKPRGRS
jgi:uncharacterized protein (DUF1778 family)